MDGYELIHRERLLIKKTRTDKYGQIVTDALYKVDTAS